MTTSTKRLLCPRCTKPLRACICAFVQVLDNATEVLILQHSDEIHHPKNSAGLLHLCLKQSRLCQGEVFDEAQLQAVLSEGNKQAILLYPALENDTQLAATQLVQCDEKLDVSRLRLVVLDATWRKSRLMLLQNPQLQSLPRLALSEVPESQYVIRNAHQAHQLSTLEATTYALMALEKTSVNPNDYSALLQIFAELNAQQIGFGVLNKVR